MRRISAIAAFACLGAIASCQDANHPPSLVLVANQFVLVGQRMEIPLIGADADGDTLAFAVEGLPEAATITPTGPITATLTWSPSITDTQPGGTLLSARAIARDGHGGEASQDFTVSVFPVFGTPTFDLPAGIALNLARQDALDLPVRVKDEDSTSVTLSVIEAPEGAVLSRSGAKSAILFWRPDPAQREQTVHRIILGAEDGDHGLITHTLLVVLLNADEGAGCAGTPPRLEHVPPADVFLGEGPIRFEATVTDAESTVASVTVGFTLGDPTAGLETLVMTREAEGSSRFQATLAPEALPAQGALLRYRVLARDNDDPVGVDCDQKARAPKTGWYAIAAYPPGADPAACLDDGAEPDDGAEDAPLLGTGSYPNRRLCPADPDAVRVPVAAGERLTVTLTRAPSHGSPRLTLTDELGEVVDEDTGDGPGLRVVDPRGVPGTRLLTVTPGEGDGGLSYDLEIALASAPCVDDPLEPDDSPAEAVPMTPGVLTGGVLCAGDEDWYRFSLAAGERLEATLDHDAKLGDLDLELRDPTSGALLEAAGTLASLETLRFVATTARAVALGVVGYQGAGNAYRLETTVTQVGASCEDDILGPHATAAQAVALMSGLFEHLSVCPDAPDWFAVELNGGETVTVLAESEGSTLDVDILTAPTGEPAASSTAAPGELAEASLVAPGPGRLWYRVSASAPTGYTLLQDITDPDGPCQPDRFEPNDTAAAATPLGPGVQTQLRLCGEDVDAFRLTLDAFDVLTVLTAHVDDGYTDLTLLDPTGEPLDSAYDLGLGVDLEILTPEPGDYTLVISPFETERVAYDLSIVIH